MPHTLRVAAAAVVLLLGTFTAASAEETRITVRVLSKNAKFIGTSMGGARVIVRDADTGEILAEGLTAGSTGETGRILPDGPEPAEPLSSPGSASFTAVLDLQRPRRIEVEAIGPMAQAQAANRASSTQWVVPGKHVEGGDAWLLTIPGFAVDVLSPAAHSRFRGTPIEVELVANLVMM